MSASAPRQSGDDTPFLVVVALFVVAAGLWLFWEAFHVEIAYWSLRIDWTLMGILDWHGVPWVGATRRELATVARHAATVGPGSLWSALAKGGLFFAPFTLLFTGLLARTIWQHPSNATRRGITADSLPWIMAKFAPAIVPVLYAPNLLQNDPPQLRPMMWPDEWAKLNRLVINERLDRERTLTLLVHHLGKRIESPHDLAPHERALFAAFGARLLSDGKDLGEAQALLDRLNLSCHAGTFDNRRGYPDLALASAMFEKYAAHPDAKRWVSAHGYSRTLLHAMHMEAIKFGKLASSHFWWLKGMDRGLWAALNTTGRKVPFIESLAVFTQTRWETYVETLGVHLREPHLEDALTAIEAYLAKVGLIPPPKKKPE